MIIQQSCLTVIKYINYYIFIAANLHQKNKKTDLHL